MAIGTPFFMAPEQFADARQADWRSDVYSLGCTLHFLLTGQPPYVRGTPLETVKAHLVAPIPSLKANRSDVPTELQSAFSIMVAKNVDDRYQTMAEVITDLRALAPKKK
jgi:serine/threonine-protein kinase